MDLLKVNDMVSLLNKAMKQQGKQTSDTEVTYVCPFHTAVHNVHRKKFGINLETQEFNCFACGASGKSLYGLFKKLELDKWYFDKLYTIVGKTDKYKKENNFSIFDGVKDEKAETTSLPKEFISLSNTNENDITIKKAKQYLKSRGVTEVDVLRYNIGFCESGKYFNRVIIPSYDSDGKLNFFTGRDIFNQSSLKYLNCEFSKNIIGFESTIDFSSEIVIVEGPMDAISVRRNCVPLFGKMMSEKLKIQIIKSKCPAVYVMLDNDAVDSSFRICEFLVENGINTYMVDTREKDASAMGFEKTWQIIRSSYTISKSDIFRYKINKGLLK